MVTWPLAVLLTFAFALSTSASVEGADEVVPPWIAPTGTQFPYKGLHNDLDKMLQVQQRDNWITMTIWSTASPVKRFGLNFFFSLYKYGKQPNVVIGALNDASLADCDKLNLPCYNLSRLFDDHISNEASNYGSQQNKKIYAQARRFASTIMEKGYHLNGMDVDALVFRNINSSLDSVFRTIQPDGVFVTEEGAPPAHSTGYINIVNTATYALLSNSRTKALMDRWNVPFFNANDQKTLNVMHEIAYAFCDTYASCLSVKRRGLAALWRHPSFFLGTSCIAERLDPGMQDPTPCSLRRLYVHFLCVAGWDRKAEAWDKLKFWLVDDEGRPLWQDGGGTGGPHPYFPCDAGPAWAGMIHRP